MGLSEDEVVARVDFAYLTDERLLIYGWILGFAKNVESAFINIGDITIDLSASCNRIDRPDVSQHFFGTDDDGHGFFALIDSMHSVAGVDELILSVTLLSGRSQESRWPVQRHEQPLESLPRSVLATLESVLPALPAADYKRLRSLLPQSVDIKLEENRPTRLSPPLEFELNLCCVLDERILFAYGWYYDPAKQLNAVQLGVGIEIFDLSEVWTRVPRMTTVTNSNFPLKSCERSGFFLVVPISTEAAGASNVTISITQQGSNSVYQTWPILRDDFESKTKLFEILGNVPPEEGMVLTDRLSAVASRLSGLESFRDLMEVGLAGFVEKLPSSIHFTSQLIRYSLHIDNAISIPGKGIFVSGWSYAGDERTPTVLCRCGKAKFDVGKNWIRHTRRDVTKFLEAAGTHAPDDEHGFTCYVTLQNSEQHCWMTVIPEGGEERRIRVPAVEESQSAIETVRSLLDTFHSDHRELRKLMDRQVGPAVKSVWDTRRRPPARKTVERFGIGPVDPDVSIIVPLYGRWDFAEIQMSQFANDADFKNIDLIYVVDDPSIYEQFHSAAPSLFGIYQIPFSIAFSGMNLGFSGANNFAARHACGKFILLLNSDVFPKRPGWIRELLQIHGSLETPGLLGVKLLYEDGTLQHAGIEFRRFAKWGGMWINDHPLKGQMSHDLKGIREVNAVTAACVLIEADLFRSLKGLSEDYIIGDFEDSDLSLAAIRAGLRNYVALDIELYHLERQSQNNTGDAKWRSNLTAYNCWLHNKRWSPFIEEITTARSSALPVAVFEDNYAPLDNETGGSWQRSNHE